MKNFMWKKMLASVLAAALVFPTIFQGVVALATEVPAETQTETEAETQEAENAVDTEAPVEKEEGMSMADIGLIPDGIVIAGIEAGGMTGEELRNEVSDMIAGKENTELTIGVAGESADLTMSDVGLCWGNESEVAEAMKTAVSGNIIAQYKVAKDIEVGELNTGLEYGIDIEVARAAMQELLNQFGLEPVNATATFNGSGFDITEDVPGVDADLDAAIDLLLADLDGWKGTELEIEIPAEIVEAEIQTEYYEGIGLISEFSTEYWSTESSNRNVNVQVAANNINGHWFAPGETISVNEMIGKVDAAHGFMLAGAYVNGGTQDMYGGGICQVATTLYNCYLDLELEKVYRKNHSMHVTYVPFSMDAAISPQSNLDCIFINNTGHPLYIQMYTEGHDLYAKFYGIDDRDPGRKVEYRSVILEGDPEVRPEEIDNPNPDMEPGTVYYERAGHPYIKSQLYKDVYQDGVLISSELMHTDVYKPLAAIRWYGPAYDDEGTAYYIDNKGFAVDEEGNKYRLSGGGTWFDDPLDGYAWDESTQSLYPTGKGGSTSGESESAGESTGESAGSSESTDSSATTAPTTAASAESSSQESVSAQAEASVIEE